MNDSRVIKTTVELTGEGDYKKRMNEVANALKSVDAQFKAANAQFDKNDKSLAALSLRYDAYTERLDLQRAKLKLIREEYDKIVAAEGDNSETARRLAVEYNKVSEQAQKTEKALEKIGKQLKIGKEEADASGEKLADAASAEKKLGDAADKASGKLRKVSDASKEQKDALKFLAKEAEKTAGKLSKALAGVTTAAVGVSAKAYMEFGKEMSNVQTLADTSAVSLEELSRQAIKASNESQTAAEQIAQGAYTALSSGVDTANVMRYTEEAAKAAKAGQADLNTVVDGSTSIMNAWKIASSESTSVFEKLLVAQDKGKTTLGEISKQIGQVTGLAPQLNISLEETLAAVAALTKNGVQTSSAISGLRAVMSNVIKPTAEAAETAKTLGLEFNAAALQSKGLTGFLQDVLDKTGGSTEELAKLFGSVEGLSQIMLLGGSAAGDYADALEAMQNSTGRLNEAFNIVTDNSAARLEGALNRLKNNAIEFGQTLSPYIDMASGSLEKLSKYISGLSETEQKALLQTALWTAGGLKAISMLSKMVIVVKALGAAAGPVGLAATAIAAVTAAVIALNKAADEANLSKTWEGFLEEANENVDGIVDSYTTAASNLAEKAPNIYQVIKDKLTDGEADTGAVVEGLKTNLTTMFTEAQTKLTGMGASAAVYAQTLQALEEETTAWIDGMAGKSTEYVKAHLGELEAIQAKVEEVMAEIDAANNALANEGKVAYDLTVAGATTNQDTIAKGVQYAYQGYKLDLQAIEEEAAARIAEADQAFANGVTDASQHLQAEQAIEAWQAEENARLEQVYREQMSKLLRGVYEGFAEASPEETGLVKEISEKLNLAEALQKAADELADTWDEAELSAAREKVQKIYERIFGEEGIEIPPGQAYEIGQQLYADVNKALKQLPTTDGGIVDTLMEVLNSEAGGALGIDTTNLEDVFKAAMGDVGGAGVDGIVEGMSDPENTTTTAAEGLADKTAAAAETAFGSAPTKKTLSGVGESFVQHIIDGLHVKEGELDAMIAAMSSRAAAAAASAAALIAGVNAGVDAANRTASSSTSNRARGGGSFGTTSSGGMSSTKNTTVNVSYSGAFTKREAQRFGIALANQINSDITGKGG